MHWALRVLSLKTLNYLTVMVKCPAWFKRKPKITVGGVVTGLRYGDAGKANAGKAVGFHVDLEDGSSCTATGLTQATH